MDAHSAEYQGRKAFRQYGVRGEAKNPYSSNTLAEAHMRAAFLHGFSEERYAAADYSLREAVSYHALSVRDNAADRAWAEKFTARAALAAAGAA